MTETHTKPDLKIVPKRWTYSNGVWHDSQTGWRIKSELPAEDIEIHTDRGTYSFFVPRGRISANAPGRIDLTDGGKFGDTLEKLVKKDDPEFYEKIKDAFRSCYACTDEQVEFIEADDA